MSVKGALEVLARVECGGKKVALLGDMLGEDRSSFRPFPIILCF